MRSSMDAQGPETVHLEEADVAAYLDRTLSVADRARVEAHLADCERCREEVTQVARLLHDSVVRRRWYSAAGLAAAAAALLLLVWPRGSEQPAGGGGHRGAPGARGAG